MLLAIDVGNTNITLGVFDGKELIGTFRMTSGTSHTSDEYGTSIRNILRDNNLAIEAITDVIIASVVPNVMHSLTSCVIKYFNTKPIIIEAGIKTGIRVATDEPRKTGADRIVDAAGAYSVYGGPVIVIDYGTATTYDLVEADGTFRYGVTAPGIRISAKALWEGAAKLPEIEIKKPQSILAKETVSSMQAGLIYGQIGQTEYIVKKIIAESGLENVKVVATGGLGGIISAETDVIDVYNANLTLQGMQYIFEKQGK